MWPFHLWPAISKDNEEGKKRKWSALTGVFFATLSALSTILTAIIVKKISLHPAQSAFYRFTGSLALSIPEIVKCNENPFGPKGLRLILSFAGIFGAASMFLSFIAYRYLPLCEVFVIFASTPIFVTTAGHLFLKEFCDIFQSFLLVVAVVGIILTSKLPSQIISTDISPNYYYFSGLVAAILSVSCRTFQMIIIRKAKQVPHPLATFACSWAGVMESSLLMPVFTKVKLHTCGTQWVDIVLIGFLCFSDQAFMSKALHCETAGLVATTRCSVNIILGFLFQIILFHDKIDYFDIIGAVLVSFSIISLSLRRLLSSS